ncbi:Cytidylate kinase [bacterium YEK0313]|nr:Cytidylate kinase [bacterium YEK0313]
MIIAIDGPAASGKGTLARRLAGHYGLPHLDTGLLYRGVGQAMLERGLPLDDAAAAAGVAAQLNLGGLDPETLRTGPVGAAASVVAAHAAVRQALIALQRAFAAQPGGAVLDGRDIGTVIAPEAQAKLFVTASAEERARRRFRELVGRGELADTPDGLAGVLADIRQRDARDSGRAAAPLKVADDAVTIDTTALGIEEAFAAALAAVEARRP